MNDLDQIIARIPAWANVKDIQVERIAGLTNINYRITVNGECFVLRISGQNTARLGINRTHEVAALQAAAMAGIGPQVVAFLPPQGHLVTRWINGQHWTKNQFRTIENVRLLIEAVKRIHTLPPNGARFSPFRRVESYLETARSFNVPLPLDLDIFLESMRVKKKTRNMTNPTGCTFVTMIWWQSIIYSSKVNIV
jgi:thiamine kinase-like enzyme